MMANGTSTRSTMDASPQWTNGAMSARDPSHASASGWSRMANLDRYDSGLPKYWNTTRSTIATTKTSVVRLSSAAAPGGGSGSHARTRCAMDACPGGAARTRGCLRALTGETGCCRTSGQLTGRGTWRQFHSGAQSTIMRAKTRAPATRDDPNGSANEAVVPDLRPCDGRHGVPGDAERGGRSSRVEASPPARQRRLQLLDASHPAA